MFVLQTISRPAAVLGAIMLTMVAMSVMAISTSAADAGAPRCVTSTNHGSGVLIAWQTPADTDRSEASYEMNRTSDVPDDDGATIEVNNKPIPYEDLDYLYSNKPDHPFHQVKNAVLCSDGAGEEDAEVVLWHNYPPYRNSTYTYETVAVYDNNDRIAADPVHTRPEGSFDRPDEVDPNQDKTVLHGLSASHEFVNGRPKLTIT